MTDNKRFTTIDDYISTFPGEVQTVLENVRQAIHHAAPEATETMSYGMPTFDLNGKHVVFFAAWKRHLSLYPLPAGDEAFQQELLHYTRARGSIQFPFDTPIPYDFVERIVTLLIIRESPEKEREKRRMKTVQSADGTTIAFDKFGKGSALILVGGALEQRAMDSETAQLAPLLAEYFTVLHYDRRGRGDSTDMQPYAVPREIEDIDALVTEAGGSACMFGISSGAALALEAAIKLGDKIKKLAMYEAPYNDDEAARQAWKAYRKRLADALAHGCRGDALALFMLLVGMPADHLDQARQHPLWPMWEAGAPTLAYDAAVMGEDASVPIEKAVHVAVPTLVMDGSASFPFMHVTATALANAIPRAQHRTLQGQTHEVAVSALAPVLVEFFNSRAAASGEQFPG